MLGLMDGAFEPSSIYPDKIGFMTSIKHLQSVRSDNNCITVVEKIKDLLSSKNTRLQGLQFLEIALQQNPDIFLKGRWTASLYEILKEEVSYILKEHVCKILCMLIPYMTKDTVANAGELQTFASFLFPFLLTQIENKVEWIESAGMCMSTCLKCFPMALEIHKSRILKIICHQISYSVSSKTFEVFAECFCLIPGFNRDKELYIADWKKQYLMTLKSMHYMLNGILTFIKDECVDVPGIDILPFDDLDSNRVYPDYMKGVRRFINLCKCLAKMLSTSSRGPVEVPIKLTLECIQRLFPEEVFSTILSSSLEMQIVLSTLSQVQIAALAPLESLFLNFPNIISYSCVISLVMNCALQASSLSNVSCETISPLRHAVWRLIDKWVSAYGTKVSFDILAPHSMIIQEILKDISVDTSSQANVVETLSKSKKTMGLSSGRKNFVNKSQQVVCKEALKALESILYSGACFISKQLLQDIFAKVVEIAYTIAPFENSPFPYDDEMCRKRLYSVLLAIAVVTKTDQREPIQCANGIFRKALLDPSPKVVRLCHKATATCRLYLHPKKPIPVVQGSDKARRAQSAVVRFPEWSTVDYVQNPTIENVSNASERIAQTFRNPNEGEMLSDEYMQVDAHYSEQAAENQCNGEDILEIRNSSQVHDDDSEVDDEDEDEDEEPSFGEEEINQEAEMQAEHLYIPSTSKMQVLTPVHITPETEQIIGDTEYEDLRPCGKSDESNKSMLLNGVRSGIVPEEEIPSTSAHNVASENGIYGFEDEDLEEEEGEEDEEEESVGYPAEKKVPDYFESPAKKQKIDNETKEEPEDEREVSRSPTLVEMKADFCCNEVDSVKS